jgi:DNA replication protein DnaD
MARAMFEYTKEVLQKVSFNSELFCRELEKALQRLLPYEIKELTIWLKQFILNKPELFICMALVK